MEMDSNFIRLNEFIIKWVNFSVGPYSIAKEVMLHQFKAKPDFRTEFYTVKVDEGKQKILGQPFSKTELLFMRKYLHEPEIAE